MADRLNVPASEAPKDTTAPVTADITEPSPGVTRIDVRPGSEPADPPKEPLKAPEADPPKAPETPADAEKALGDSGLDMGQFREEFAKDGKLSEASYEKLAKAGIDRATVDAYVEGQKARASKLAADFAEMAGGQEKLTRAIEWAGKNLSDAEKSAYNAALDSGNEGQARLALRGILAAYTEKMGNDPTLIDAAPAGVAKPSVAPFESRAQVVEAMKDKRYKTDPAYRREVERRLDVSDFGVFGRV